MSEYRRPHGRPVVVGASFAAVLAVALALRLVNLSSSPPTFHPTRQYAGLAVAKARYVEGRHDVAPAERAAVMANGDSAPRLEPRLLEAVVAAGYGLLGGERVWLGGLLSSLSWMMGGACLFLLARRLASELAGWVAMAFSLFLPYGIEASRSFQPDPAMVAFMVAALLAVVRWFDEPTRARLAAAAALTGVAVLLKPVCVFVLVATFLALAIEGGGLRKGLLRPATFVYLIAGVLPAASYYLYGIVRGNELSSFAGSGFLPHLLVEGFFWQGWARLVNGTVIVLLALLAAVAVVVGRSRRGRALMAGAWVGYLVYGLVFDYHIHTHDYYQLPLIPIVGLGLGMTADAAVSRIRRIELSGGLKAAMVIGLVFLVASVAYADVGVARIRPSPSARQLSSAATIGKLVGHSTRTVMLADAYGRPLAYAGSLAGSAWPKGADFRFMALQGMRRRTTTELFTALTANADWFIVTDLDELDRQPELKPLLDSRSRLAGEGDGFLVYDLRRSG